MKSLLNPVKPLLFNLHVIYRKTSIFLVEMLLKYTQRLHCFQLSFHDEKKGYIRQQSNRFVTPDMLHITMTRR